MSLFDQFRQKNDLVRGQVTLGPAEAFTAIILLVVSIDGHIADSEMELLNTVLGRMHLFRSYSDDVMARMFDNLMGILQRHGAEVLLDAAMTSLPHDLYETTFAIATDVVLADGEVTYAEEDLLSDLAKLMGISDDLVQQIIRVMLIKNKG